MKVGLVSSFDNYSLNKKTTGTSSKEAGFGKKVILTDKMSSKAFDCLDVSSLEEAAHLNAIKDAYNKGADAVRGKLSKAFSGLIESLSDPKKSKKDIQDDIIDFFRTELAKSLEKNDSDWTSLLDEANIVQAEGQKNINFNNIMTVLSNAFSTMAKKTDNPL